MMAEPQIYNPFEDFSEMHVGDATAQEMLRRINADLRRMAQDIPNREIRYLVDSYYTAQENRKAAGNQIRAMGDLHEPSVFLRGLFDINRLIENRIKWALGTWAQHRPVGQWAMSIHGIGPVIAAGLMAHVDVDERYPYAGSVWSLAGLNPKVRWEKGKKRPWNAALKTLTWHIGESFVKSSNAEGSHYGWVYKDAKRREWNRNLTKQLSDQATTSLKEKKWSPSTPTYRWLTGRKAIHPDYRDDIPFVIDAILEGFIEDVIVDVEPNDPHRIPMLSPDHIHSRAKRKAVTLFLSHWHHVAYEVATGEAPPKPYVFVHEDGHTQYIPPYNWPME